MKILIAVLLSSIILFSGSGILYAQFTINSGDVLTINTRVIESSDTLNPNVNLGTPGFGNNWDFTSTVEHVSEDIWVRNAEDLSGFSNFPDATIGFSEDDSTQIFLKETSSELEILGLSLIQPNDTSREEFNQTIITFPSTISTKFSDDLDPRHFEFEFGGDPDGAGPHPFVDSLMVRIYSTLESDFDAVGTLKTSLGEFDAMRQLLLIKSIDTVFMYVNGNWKVLSQEMSNLINIDSVSKDTTYECRFWAEGHSFPMANAQFDPVAGIIYDLSWIKYYSVGVSQNESLKEIMLFPNPASNTLNVNSWESGLQYEITDVAGRLIERSILTHEFIDVSKLSNGHYKLRLFKNQKEQGVGSFQINR